MIENNIWLAQKVLCSDMKSHLNRLVYSLTSSHRGGPKGISKDSMT